MIRPLSPAFRLAVGLAWLGAAASWPALALDGPTAGREGIPEAPRIRAMVELAAAAELGLGQPRDPTRAALLYCEAAAQGSAQAQFQLGRIYVSGSGLPRNLSIAATLFEMAAHGGHRRAAAMLALTGTRDKLLPVCLTDPESAWSAHDAGARPVDIERYVGALPRERRRVAALIRKLAPRFDVDRRLALSIAAVESNFDARALSPKNAQGVMQLIPETAERFKVKNAFDPEQNVRGGLAYLRWLLKRFGGDVPLVVAAYNAGEGAVERHKGVPPYAETRSYLRRVAQFFHLPRPRDSQERLRPQTNAGPQH